MSVIFEIEALTGMRPRPALEDGARFTTVRTCLSEQTARQIAESDFGREIYIWNVFDVPRGEWTNPWSLPERDFVYRTKL